MLQQPHFVLTWYPGSYPSATGGVVLQSADHYIETQSTLGTQIEQLVQRADYLRAAAPDFWVRGNRTASLEWEEIRHYDSPGEALAAALAIAEAMPEETGWLRIDIPDQDRAWAASPCVIRATGSRHGKSGTKTRLALRWTLDCGPLAEIATDDPDGDHILLESGFELLCEDGSEIALESAA